MLAVRDENIVNAAQAARQAQGKGHLAPKTPGARYPKTPSRFPLNDENGMGGKVMLGKAEGTIKQTGQNRSLVTPSGTQARAPLGAKTTNAKAGNGQATGVKNIVKEIERTQTKQTTVKKPKLKGPALDPLKVSVLNDPTNDEHDIEYAPARAKDLPYESDVFPDGELTFEGLKKENMFKGYYNHFYNPMGEDGKRLLDRQHEQRMKKALKQHDADIMKEIETMDWSISDLSDNEQEQIVQKKTVPVANPDVAAAGQGTVKRVRQPAYPPTINSRRAASALSTSSDTTIRQRKATGPVAPVRRPVSSLLPSRRTAKTTVPSKTAPGDSVVADAASRSTLGYTKGRSASSLLNKKPSTTGLGQNTVRPRVRPTSTIPSTSTIPASQQHQRSASAHGGDALHKLNFLSIFEPEEEDDEANGFGGVPHFDDDEEEFELKLEI